MILFNGASGGLGRNLAEPLRRRGEPWHALGSRLEDGAGLAAELERLEPDGPVTFIQLAALVSVPACEADPAAAWRTNVTDTGNTVQAVLEWTSRLGVEARVVYVSSGHVYAGLPDGSRTDESAPTAPRSVYAQTKLAGEQAVRSAAGRFGVPVLVARVFGLIGPHQPANYVLPSLIERARTGALDGIPGLDYVRDYLDARDVCENLLRLASADWQAPSVCVNVCSGVPLSIRELLHAVLRETDADRADELAGRATPTPGRSGDLHWLVGDPGRFTGLTGTSPACLPLKATVADAVAATAMPAMSGWR